MMKYKIINNFLSKSECENLVRDGKKFVKSNTHTYQKINVNRNTINSSSISFSDLCLNSKIWNNLASRLCSEKFFSDCFESLEIDKKNFEIKHFYNRKNNSKIFNMFKKVGLSQVKSLKLITLLKYLFLRIFLNFEKILKFNFITSISKKPIELLYDYSVAGKGYFREIHRDSDNRLVIFLIYLNKINKNNVETGGQLEIYRNKDKDDKSPQPKKESCELIKSVEPEEGKLVIFQNTDESFHAVKKIEEIETKRHFIYGAYTLLNGKNPFIKNSTSLKTEFHIYE